MTRKESVNSVADPEKNSIEKNNIIETSLFDLVPQYDKYWFKIPHLLRLNLCLLVIILSNASLGFDFSMLNGLQSVNKWMDDMGNPSGAVLGALSNGIYFGYFLSFWFAPWLCDTHGRKAAIIFGNAILLVGIVIQTASNGYACFLVARIVLGAGITVAAIASVPLLSEIAYPTQREMATTCYQTFYYGGAIVAAWSTYGCYFLGNTSWAWRALSVLQGLFPIIQMCFIWFVPESPRFLVSRGKVDAARSMLMKWHGGDDEERCGAFIDYELAEISNAIENEKANSGAEYKTFLKTKGNQHRLVITIFLPILMQLSGNSLVSYYLNKVLNSIGITSSSEQLIINGALMIYNQGVAMISPFFVARVGRRVMFLFSTISMLICYLIWTVLSAINQQRNFEDKMLGKGVLAMIFLYYFAYDSGLCGLPYLYLTEVLPFSLRSKGVNIFSLIQYLALIFTGFVNPIAMDAIAWKYYIVWTCWLSVEILIVYFVFPETRGYSLEEVAVVFGDSVVKTNINNTNSEKSNLQELKTEEEQVERNSVEN